MVYGRFLGRKVSSRVLLGGGYWEDFGCSGDVVGKEIEVGRWLEWRVFLFSGILVFWRWVWFLV